MTPEEYAKAHQKAFRTAFNFLNAHFPPGETDEWWLQTAQDGALATEESSSEPLTVQLLIGVTNYLGEEYKRRYQSEKADD